MPCLTPAQNCPNNYYKFQKVERKNNLQKKGERDTYEIIEKYKTEKKAHATISRERHPPMRPG